MACNCGKSAPKVAITSAEATAMLASAAPKYKVTLPDGTENVHTLYVDAKTEAVQSGGVLTEQR